MATYTVRHMVIEEADYTADSPEEALAIAKADMAEGNDKFIRTDWSLQVLDADSDSDNILVEE